MSNKNNEVKNKKIPEDVYDILLRYLEQIKFGSVTLTIQDGKIVQIEGSEKIRTSRKGSN